MEFYEIEEVEEIEYVGTVYDIELEKNHYFAANSLYSHNCRLISDSEMLDIAAQSNSFGAGSIGSLGSHRVATINFNRLALESTSIEDFWKRYNIRIENAKDILEAHKTLIYKLADRGLQQFISNGWINMNRMFSTFGILGIVECADILTQRFNIDYDIMKDILVHLDNKVREYTVSEDGYVFNIEQIPGESYAIRLSTVDKILFANSEGYYVFYEDE